MNVVQPFRVSRTYTQSLVAPPDVVFPLLCPVRCLLGLKYQLSSFRFHGGHYADD